MTYSIATDTWNRAPIRQLAHDGVSFYLANHWIVASGWARGMPHGVIPRVIGLTVPTLSFHDSMPSIAWRTDKLAAAAVIHCGRAYITGGTTAPRWRITAHAEVMIPGMKSTEL